MDSEFYVDGITLAYGNERIGNVKLMEHQCEVRNAKDKLVVLDAPTGSGKTLAILLNFIEYNKNTNKSGFFLYPTNELVKDQEDAIANLLNLIGERYAILSPEGPIGDVEKARYIIAEATGEMLESLETISDEKTQGGRLEWLLKYLTKDKSYILLTNIDTLYLVTKLKYAQPKGWRLLQEFTRRFGFLSVDEFHLYSGIMYANLVYLLHLYKEHLERIVLATATHNKEGLELVEEALCTKAKKVSAKMASAASDGRKVRFPCKIKLKPADASIAPEEVASEVKAIQECNSECENLVIVDSVVKSHFIYEILSSKYSNVSEISGLVPKNSRKIDKITVGTSAIEVGIDFKTKFLVAETKNASSLIQRLGRVARHCEGDAVLFIPALCHSKICEELNEKKRENGMISYESFISVIKKYIDDPPAYYDFAKSKYGGLLFAGILSSIIQASNRGAIRRDELERRWKELRPNFLAEKPEDRYSWKMYRDGVINAGARGDMLSVPARYNGDYLRVSIFDIPRLDFQLIDSKDIPNLPSWIKEKWIVDIKGFKAGKRTRLIANFVSEYYRRYSWPEVIKTMYQESNGSTNFTIINDEPILERSINKLLHGKFIVPGCSEDWRLSMIENTDGSKLIIGMDSLIYCWLNSEK